MSIYNNVPPGLMEDGRVKQSMFDTRAPVQMMRVTDPNASDYGNWVPAPGQDLFGRFGGEAQPQQVQGPVLRGAHELFKNPFNQAPSPWVNQNPMSQGQHINQRHAVGTL
jgi:hypothetical protein